MTSFRFLLTKYFFNTKIGRFFLVPLYEYVAVLICFLIRWRFRECDVWPRNSIISKDLVPGVSDIDITVMAHGFFSKSSKIFLNDYLKGLRIIFPILGECNFYEKGDLDLVVLVANHFELTRDPRLKEILEKLNSSAKNEEDKAVYVLRQWHSDQLHLNKVPEQRAYKWNRIFKRIKVGHSYSGINSVKQVISEMIGDDFDSEANMLCYYPHLWIGQHWQDDNLFEQIHEIANYSEVKRKVCLAQVKWEIYGILGQLPFLPKAYEMIWHFEHLEKIALATNLAKPEVLRPMFERIEQIIGTKYKA